MDDSAYVIQQVESHDALRVEALRQQGFCFHERFFFVEASLKAADIIRGQVHRDLPGIILELSYEYTTDIYELAYQSFETDRRFHLEQRFDQEGARAVMKAYIDQCRERACLIFSARKERELLGYIIADTQLEKEAGCIQIMLGVTRRGIKGKMMALPLYSGLLGRMMLSENGSYTKYCGYVSSANIAAMNLHYHLGARVTKVVDEYIYRVKGIMNEKKLTEYLVDEILHRLPGQIFSVRRTIKEWTDEDRQRFEQELQYLTEKYTMEEIIEGYIFYTNSVMEETRYFKEYGDYRCHSFAEVDAYIYADPERMKLYMLGLTVAEFLWMTVLQIHRFYAELIRNVSGKRYLEIGPGHGKYFLEAYNLHLFERYDAVDVSETAIAMTRDYLDRYMAQNSLEGGGTKYHLFCQDATKFSIDGKYDFIVIQEVLEHIEDPLGMLRSIHRMLDQNGKVYTLFPINAPSPAHIFLFRSISHVKEIVSAAGFEIVKEEYITANKLSIEQAEQKKLPIDACLVLRKKREL